MSAANVHTVDAHDVQIDDRLVGHAVHRRVETMVCDGMRWRYLDAQRCVITSATIGARVQVIR